MSPEPTDHAAATMSLPQVVSGDNRRLRVIQRLAASLRGDAGQTLTEYALIIGLIAIGSVAALSQISGLLSDVFNSVTSAIDSVVP